MWSVLFLWFLRYPHTSNSGSALYSGSAHSHDEEVGTTTPRVVKTR